MELAWSSLTSYIPYLISALAILLLLEQITYLKKKRFLPGPTLVLPFVGNAISLVRCPTTFWTQQSNYAKSTPLGISSNYILGRYILYVYSTDLSHKIFANVRPDAFELVIHPFGKKLFGQNNLIYLNGQAHTDLRRRIAPSFGPKALQTYIQIQQRIIIQHMQRWCEMSSEKKAITLQTLCRDMNLETSQTVFVGPYLNDDARLRFNLDYHFLNLGLMRLPIDLPGFAFRNARMAWGRLVDTLAECAAASERKMSSGEEDSEPTCLIDFWMQENLRENRDDYSCREIGSHLFLFLFAAQDASTSSLLWAVVFLESHPHVLERVRKEVARYDAGALTFEQLREMKYTEAVAREVVRIRAPATMVPHVASADFRLTQDYVVPKGTLVFPSVYDSCFQGFTEPDQFDPDRFMEERREDRVYRRNFLAFGAGTHQCVGQQYSINHLMLFIAALVSMVDFRRERTQGCDDVVYVPTIAPKDDCRVFLSLRREWFSR